MSPFRNVIIIMPYPISIADFPEGFSFFPQFVSIAEAESLLGEFTEIDFSNIEMHGVVARRRAAHFGLRYNYSSRTVTAAPPLPEFLLEFRARFARMLGIAPEEFPQALVNEYSPGAAIGWHIDGPVYELIAGFSVGADCIFKLRPREVPEAGTAHRSRVTKGRKGNAARKSVISFTQPAGSAYAMRGAARWNWEHSIPPVKALRYSVTFRTLKTTGSGTPISVPGSVAK